MALRLETDRELESRVSIEETAQRLKIEAETHAKMVWPASVNINGRDQHVPFFKSVEVAFADRNLRVTGTIFDGRTHSVFVRQNEAEASFPGAAGRAIGEIKKALQDERH